MWTTIAAVAVPLILAAAGFIGGGGSRLSKKIAHHADLIGKLEHAPDARRALSALLAKEVAWLDEDETRRRTTPFPWRRFAAILFWLALSLVGAFSLASAAVLLRQLDEPLTVLSNIFFVLAAVMSAACGFFIGRAAAKLF